MAAPLCHSIKTLVASAVTPHHSHITPSTYCPLQQRNFSTGGTCWRSVIFFSFRPRLIHTCPHKCGWGKEERKKGKNLIKANIVHFIYKIPTSHLLRKCGRGLSTTCPVELHLALGQCLRRRVHRQESLGINVHFLNPKPEIQATEDSVRCSD